LRDNPNGEGTYQMKTPAGVQAIPYSQVEQTKQTPGNDFANINEYARYTKDRAYDPKPHTSDGYVPPEVEQAKGALKSAVQVPNTLVGWLDAITDKAARMTGAKNPESGDVKPRLEKVENAVAPGVTNPIHGFDQGTGGFAETLAEWLYGEGEARAGFEALSQSQKMEKVAKAAKFIEEHPALAGTLRAAATGAGSGGQAAAHGATAGQAAEAAAAGGLAGGAGELIAGTGSAARNAETTRQAMTAAHEAAPGVLAERTAAEGAARQATAQTQIHSVAQQATKDALERLNATREPVTVQTPLGKPSANIPARVGADSIDQGIASARAKANLGSSASAVPDRLMPQNPIVQELGSRAALVPDRIWNEIPGSEGMHVETQVPPNFAQVDAAKEAAGVSSFGEAAEKIRQAAQPVYKQLDSATGGEFNKLRMARTAAYKSGNEAARREADLGIEKLLADKPKGVSSEDYATAKSAWADTKTLDRLHQAVEGSFNGISEDMAAQSGTGERLLRGGNSQGSTLQINLGRLLRSRDMAGRIEGLIGKEGIANLYRASALVSNPEMKKATASLAEQVAAEFPAPAKDGALHRVAGGAAGGSVGAAIGHAIGGQPGGAAGFAVGSAAGAALSDGARDVMRKMVMSPRVGQLMDFAVRNHVGSKVAAAAVAAQIRREQPQEENKEDTTQ
jgi:hypothetical protein